MTEKIKHKHSKKKYRYSFDLLRFVCISLLVFIDFGLYFIPYFSVIQPFLFFSHGTLFAIYGYLVLRNGAELKKNIKHTLKVFSIMLIVYGILTALYYWLFIGNPIALFSKRAIFNFIVLNYWSIPFCSTIWFVQSTLYALIAFWILRKLKEYDWLLCLVLFLFASLVGEFAGVIGFNFLGYTYIPGNFLTKTMPYMLLGRLIHNNFYKIRHKLRIPTIIFFFVGLTLSIAEFLTLYFTGYLVYPNHFIGFILMSASLCMICVCKPYGGKIGYFLRDYLPTINKGIYFVANPLGYILLIVALYICKTEQQYALVIEYMGIGVLVLTIVIFWAVAFLKTKFKLYDKMQEEELSNETEI